MSAGTEHDMDMHMDMEPARLLEQHGTPNGLRDALQALREQAPDNAASARIRTGMLARLTTPATVASSGARWLLSIVLLGLLGLSVWSLTSRLAPRDVPPAAAAPRVVAAMAARMPAPRPALAPVALPEPAVVALEPELVAPAASEPVRAPKRSRVAAAPATLPMTPMVASAIEPEKVEPSVVAPLPPAAKSVAPSAVAPSEEAERLFADPQDEAGLLYRAKRLSSSDPNGALRLVVLHEASFPNGAFAQERDMLEIQLHQRMGHASTAKRLASAFKRRYPDSVYRVSP